MKQAILPMPDTLPPELQALVARAIAEGVTQVLAAMKVAPAPAPEEKSVSWYWDTWYPTVKDSGRGPNIRTHREYALELEFQHGGQPVRLRDLRPSECTSVVVEAWRAKLRETVGKGGKLLAPDYRDQIRLSLQACFTYHIEAGSLVGRHPLKGIPREKGWKGRKRLGYPTREFLDRFRPYCRPILADMLMLSFEAGGMRRGEMLFLRKREYDRATRTLGLQADRNKNDEPRVIVLTDEATAIVERWIASPTSSGEYVFGHPLHRDGRHVPESTLWGWLDEARALARADGMTVELAGDPFCIHHARHGYTMSMQGQAPEGWIADQLGHSSTEMINQRYGKLRGERAREQFRAMLEQRKGPHSADPPVRKKAPTASRP